MHTGTAHSKPWEKFFQELSGKRVCSRQRSMKNRQKSTATRQPVRSLRNHVQHPQHSLVLLHHRHPSPRTSQCGIRVRPQSPRSTRCRPKSVHPLSGKCWFSRPRSPRNEKGRLPFQSKPTNPTKGFGCRARLSLRTGTLAGS